MKVQHGQSLSTLQTSMRAGSEPDQHCSKREKLPLREQEKDVDGRDKAARMSENATTCKEGEISMESLR